MPIILAHAFSRFSSGFRVKARAVDVLWTRDTPPPAGFELANLPREQAVNAVTVKLP
jgi:hypothetical protein